MTQSFWKLLKLVYLKYWFMATSSIIQSNNVGASSNKKSYQGLLDANPYRNITYTKTPWQKFLGWLGFRTEADAWRENMDVQAREYDAAILQKQYDEEYNDPQSQMSRMRAAGLNPDIDGGSSIDSGSAAPLGEDPSTPMQTTGASGTLAEFANGIFGAINTAVSIVGSMQGVFGKHIQNVLGRTQVEDAVAKLGKQTFLDSLAASPLIGGDEDLSKMDDVDFLAGVQSGQSAGLEMAQKILGKYPKSIRKKAQRYVDNYWNSAPATKEAFSLWLDSVTAQKGTAEEMGKFYASEFHVLKDIYKEIGKANEDIYKLQQEVSIAKGEADLESEATRKVEAENAGTYAQTLQDLGTPGVSAGAFDSAQRNASYQNGINKIVNSTMHRIVRKLDAKSNEGGLPGVFASALLVAMSLNQMNMLPSLPSGGFSKTTGPKGITESFNIGF